MRNTIDEMCEELDKLDTLVVELTTALEQSITVVLVLEQQIHAQAEVIDRAQEVIDRARS